MTRQEPAAGEHELVTHEILVDGRPAPVQVHTCFRDGSGFCAAVAYGEVQDGCLVRIQSRCMYAEVFGARDCDCGWQLRRSRELLTAQGGVLIYLDQEGRGAGLRAKASAYRLNDQEGLDTYEAYERLGLPPDMREYAGAVRVLGELQLASVRLLTGNPGKAGALEQAGIAVTRVALQAPPAPAITR